MKDEKEMKAVRDLSIMRELFNKGKKQLSKEKSPLPAREVKKIG